MTDDAIIRIVEEHYATPEADLLLLSHLGKMLTAGGYWPRMGDNRSLYETVDAIDRIRLIRDDKASAYIAVVLKGNERLAQERIANRHRRLFLRGLPRALLLAFTLQVPADKVISVRLQPKTVYRIRDVIEPGEYLIDADLRMPTESAGDIDAMSVEDVERLEKNIRAWGLRHEVEVSTLKRGDQSSTPQSKRPEGLRAPVKSALERLYAAQDPEVAKKLIVPIDIAILLGRAD